MEIEDNKEIPEELICSVCMCLFKSPVTIDCGHTFCKICLLNSTSLKNHCPICRKFLPFLNEKPQEDHIIQKLTENYLHDPTTVEETDNHQKLLESSETFLLLDIKSKNLLFPHTKIVGTFELQSPTLLNRLGRFIARLEPPFNQFGIVSKIVSLNQLRYNIYECTIEGKSFCKIENQKVQRNTDLNEQFFYRACNAKIIYEEQQDFDFEPLYNDFFLLFSKIQERQILYNLYKIIDSHVFNTKGDNIALFYSIARLIAINDQEKYQAVISFEKETRKRLLENFIKGVDFDVMKKPEKFIDVQCNGGIKKSRAALIIAIIFFVYCFMVKSDFVVHQL